MQNIIKPGSYLNVSVPNSVSSIGSREIYEIDYRREEVYILTQLNETPYLFNLYHLDRPIIMNLLNLPNIEIARGHYQSTLLHCLSIQFGFQQEVLKHNLVDKVIDINRDTPLHLLAKHKMEEVLDHPSVDKVFDTRGDTPLHNLAWTGNKKVLNHPSIFIVNILNQTPLHYLAYSCNSSSLKRNKDNFLSFQEIKHLFPQCPFPNAALVTEESINYLLSIPSSINFIRSLNEEVNG